MEFSAAVLIFNASVFNEQCSMTVFSAAAHFYANICVIVLRLTNIFMQVCSMSSVVFNEQCAEITHLLKERCGVPCSAKEQQGKEPRPG